LSITMYSYLYILKVKNILKQKHSFSWLSGIAVFFRQDHTPISKKIVLLFAFSGWFFSVCYESFVQAESTVPFKEDPFVSLEQLIDQNYKYYQKFYIQDTIEGLYPQYLFKQLNLTHRLAECQPLNPFVEENIKIKFRAQYFDRHKLFSQITNIEYHSLPYKRLQCYLLPKHFSAGHFYYIFRDQFHILLSNSFSHLVASGSTDFFQRMYYFELSLDAEEAADKLEFDGRQARVMRLPLRIYTIFIILLILHLFSFIVLIIEILIINAKKFLVYIKQILFDSADFIVEHFKKWKIKLKYCTIRVSVREK